MTPFQTVITLLCDGDRGKNREVTSGCRDLTENGSLIGKETGFYITATSLPTNINFLSKKLEIFALLQLYASLILPCMHGFIYTDYQWWDKVWLKVQVEVQITWWNFV